MQGCHNQVKNASKDSASYVRYTAYVCTLGVWASQHLMGLHSLLYPSAWPPLLCWEM